MRIVISTIGLICAVWIGVNIGRGVEQVRLYNTMKAMSDNVDVYERAMSEVASDIAAMERYMAGDDKMMSTIINIRNNYVDPVSLDTLSE